MKTFKEIFNSDSMVTTEAPGRVNLLGEHTDYNGGFVLPTAISQKTRVQLGINDLNSFRLYSTSLNKNITFNLVKPPRQHFATYIYGCLKEVEALGIEIPFLDIFVSSNVPIGAGVSSSAALEVATLRALRKLLNLSIDDVTIAKLAQQAEIKYAGVNCGIMDQMASSLADTEHMLFMDTRSLEVKVLALPLDTEILIIDSGVSRTLANSKYNERREECNTAAQILRIKQLRNIIDPDVVEQLPTPLRERARHVISENNRVLAASKEISALDFGHLMNDSHASLSVDYQVSIPQLDLLVNLLQNQNDVFGAKLTGAGFGGACVALCKKNSSRSISKIVIERFNELGHHSRIIMPSNDYIASGVNHH